MGIIAGKRAFEAAKQPLITGLDQAGLVYDVSIYPGYCTAGDIDFYVHWARQQSYDCVLGVGGGKLMDLSKAVGALARLPVFTLPTIAATCLRPFPLFMTKPATRRRFVTMRTVFQAYLWI